MPNKANILNGIQGQEKGFVKGCFLLSFILFLYLNGKFRIKFPLDSNRNFINPTTEPVSPYRLIE